MTAAEIMTVVAACQTFPDLEQSLIERSHLLDTVEDTLNGETQVLVVEGEEGIGKTTLLAQFALNYPNRTISLFLYPTSRYGYDISTLRFDLCNQLEYLLKQEELKFDPNLGDAAYDTLLYQQIRQLMRRAKRESKPYFFILDGIDEIPDADQEIRKLILALLPLGLPGFKFLLSGDRQIIRRELQEGSYLKSFLLPRFSLDDTRRYLADLQLNQNDIVEIYKVFGGIPAKLASIKRSLRSASVSSIEALLNTSSELPRLFDIEWNSAPLNQENRFLLAVIAFSRAEQTIESLSHITGHEVDKVYSLLNGITFLEFDSKTAVVRFVSEPFRKHVAEKLASLEHKVYELLIDALLTRPHSDEAQSHLPAYLQKTRRLNDLVEYLSPAFFENMLTRAQSYRPLRHQAQMGLSAALQVTKDSDAVRFAIHQAVLRVRVEIR